ncbi:hypothetical protein VTO42DRAFT_592 [Malbranchea cinnamomea]
MESEMKEGVNRPPTAHELRVEGNVLFRDGQLAKAVEKYKAATEADPKDPLPWQNLSCAYFEVGSYTNCIIAGNRTLDLLDPEDDTRIKRTKLRLLICYMHIQQLELASKIVEELGGPESLGMRVFQATIYQTNQVWTALPEEKDAWKKIISELPRYKAKVRDVLEPFVFSHEDPRPQYDKELMRADGDFSVFFAGIGDARHMYATLLSIAQFERNRDDKTPERAYYIVINDHHPIAFARILLITLLLDELSEIKDHSSDRAVFILNTVFYIFAGTVIPRYVYAHIQRVIKAAITALETGQGLPGYLFIHPEDCQSIIDVLVDWQKRAKSFYRTSDAIRITAKNWERDTTLTGALFGTMAAPEGCENEEKLFASTGFVQPALPLFREHDEPLKTLLMNHRYRVTDTIPAVKRYLSAHWRVNITSLDAKWETEGPSPEEANFTSDPIAIGNRFFLQTGIRKPRNAQCSYDYASSFFSHVSKALRVLKGKKFTIEIAFGDYAHELEKRRHGFVPGPDGDEAPKLFNRIHMSNVPDYTGGPLTGFLYGIPMCKLEPGSYITGTCLRNPTAFATIDHYLNEYLVISDRTDLRKILQVQQVKGLFDSEEVNPELFPVFTYLNWQRSKNRPHSYAALMPRKEFVRWLNSVFFRIMAPCHITKYPIEAPLNVTIFFRLLIYLCDVGYPKHWISSVLINILEDNVVTAARAPKNSPRAFEPPDVMYETKKISTAPYVDEMAALTTIFQRVLPFSVITETLGTPQEVFEYTLPISWKEDGDVLRPTIILVFLSSNYIRLVKSGEKFDLRPILVFGHCSCPSDIKDHLASAANGGIVVVTTIRLVHREMEVKFWMTEGTLEEMAESKLWHFGLWRTDDWGPVDQTHALEEGILKKGRNWADITRVSA